MLKALLIAEKPFLKRELERVYKNNKSKIPLEIDFISQVGHIITLLNPTELDETYKIWNYEDLPIIPPKLGGWKYKVIEGKEDIYADIEKRINSGKYDLIIHAGDPDQEGELLINIVLDRIGCNLPIKRFWSNDLTDAAVLKAFNNMEDDRNTPRLKNLYDAALTRQHEDYLYGMNGSRAATLKLGSRVAVGRVKSTVLSMVVAREQEIRNFKPKTVYGVKVVYANSLEGALFDNSNSTTDDSSDDKGDGAVGVIYYDTKEEAEGFIRNLGDKGTVVSVEKKATKQYAPKLYKLASLQTAAGKLGFNADKTLQIVQSLYEKKYLSYPRTDCECISSNEEFSTLLQSAASIPELAPYVAKITTGDIARVKGTKSYVNDKELENHGHSALIPTTMRPKFENLSPDEKIIYDMVCRRFVAIFLPPIIQDKTTIITSIDNNTFRSTGKILRDAGYSVLFNTEMKDVTIPDVSKGEILDVKQKGINEKTSTCPKRFTDGTLIQAMENPAKFLNDDSLKRLGKKLTIGTSATRAGIITTLISTDKYLKRSKEKKVEYIIPTEAGEYIINNLKDLDICKVDMSGQLEEHLELIRTGVVTKDDAEEEIIENIVNMISTITNITVVGTPPASSEEKKVQKVLKKDVATYLKVSYEDKDVVKSMGARWDADKTRWYVPKGLDTSAFSKWAVSFEEVSSSTTKKVYITVTYEDKDTVKLLGARWDNDKKSWYIPVGVDIAPFKKWISQSATAGKSAPSKLTTKAIYLDVSYDDRAEAKQAGARWDGEKKQWYAPIGSNKSNFEKWIKKKAVK